jgi:hypothetical protein
MTVTCHDYGWIADVVATDMALKVIPQFMTIQKWEKDGNTYNFGVPCLQPNL